MVTAIATVAWWLSSPASEHTDDIGSKGLASARPDSTKRWPCRAAATWSSAQLPSRRGTHWKNGAMALRWAVASFVETEKSYRRIIGYDQLWMLRAHLDDYEPVAQMRKAG